MTVDDIALANQLAHEVLGRSLDELPPQTRRVLGLIEAFVAERMQQSVQAFFIGVSEDAGSTWKFMDGVSVTPDNIDLILPGFQGGMLPPKSLTQSGTK